MKTAIHPTYHSAAKITCACGNEIVTGSTLESIQVELCSACHPFYTGKQKLVDTSRRVEKFQERVAKTSKKDAAGKKEKRAKRAKAQAEKKAKAEKATKKDK